MSEQEMIEAIQEGDTRAFRALYDENATMVYRYINVRIGNPQEAEDLTAEVFVKAWQALPTFEWTGKPVRAWLLRIAHNIVIDRYRKNRPVLEFLPEWFGFQEKRFTQFDHRDEIRRAISTLSDEQQFILHMHFYEGYSLKEVAEVLEKSPNAVRVAQHRALKRLSEEMQNARDQRDSQQAGIQAGGIRTSAQA